MIGKRIGQYEILEMLGKGGMATVYRAFHPSMERYVAVKIIHQALAQDQAGKERFRQEARLITRLEHPHLLPVYDYSPDNDPPFIVMRYLEGGTLKDVLEVKKMLPLSEIAYLMRQIASALDYAHRLGVIHRDIKPSNIMIDADGNAYLADFGIARIRGEAGMTQTGFAVGTPGYMSPEQGMGVSDITGATDVYALGVMAFEMATGQSPYTGDTPMAVLMKHIQNPIPSAVVFNKELPEAIDEVFEKALAKESGDRYQSAGEFAAALSQLVSRGDINRSPENIRTVAVKAINEIKENRDESALNQLMKDFEGTRSGGMKAVSKAIDAPTTKEKVSPPASKNNAFILGAGVGLLILAVISALFFFNISSSNASATASAEANALIAADNTATALANMALVAATEEASPTNTVEPTEGPSPTNTERPTSTNTPSDTPVPTDTATPTLSPTPSVPILRTSRQLDARVGPADDFAVILTLGANEELEITGMSENGRWYQVILPTGSLGWIPSAVTFVQVFGPREDIQVVDEPDRTNTPTPTPNETATAIAIAASANAVSTQAAATSNAENTASAVAATNAEVTRNVQNTESALAAINAQATASAQAAETALALNNAHATETAIASGNAQATISAQSTTNARGTVDALLAATNASANATQTQLASLPSSTPQVIEVVNDTPGRMPYVMNFEQGADSLQGSDFSNEAWQVVNEGGQSVLIANARIDAPFIIMGAPGTLPEWVHPSSADFVVSFRINMTAVEGARIVFRYQQGLGYNVLEVTPGRMYLRRSRNAGDNPLANRDSEIFLGSGRGYSVPIAVEEWHQVRIWVEGARIFVYLDNQLIANVEDLTLPQLGAGQILLQTQNAFRPVRFDDIIIQRAEAGSDHFQAASFPSTWERSDSVRVNVGREADGNQFIEMGRDASANPLMPPTRDLELSCRIYSVEGGYTLYLRETEAGGALRLVNEAGEMRVEIIDATGTALFTQRVTNFYTRGLWQNLHIFYVGDRLEISLDGDLAFEQNLDIQLTGGLVRFATDGNDIVRFDDCLITQSAASGDEGSAFAFEILQEVNGRNFRELRSDLTEDFSDEFRTDVWWVDGLNAAGDYVVNSGEANHQNYLTMTHAGLPTFRLFRDNVGVEIFGLGQDRRSFRDSTDVLVTVDTRLPLDAFGEAWLGVRTTPTITGNDVNGYFMTVRRNRDNTMTLLVDYRSPTNLQSYFEGTIETNVQEAEWVSLMVITLDDKLAFFVNGRFVVAAEDAEQLGGTLALGVNQNTTANFDSLIIRDTSPHDQ